VSDRARLRDLSVLFIDCQSTGATPAHGALLELGWAGRSGEVVSHLTALPEGETISRQVRRVTGLTASDLRGARPVEAVWGELAARGPATAVIHFATFERKWLQDLHERFGARGDFPFDIVCTHEIARRLLPDLPRRGLRALAGYFGANVGKLRRSAEHVEATRIVWRALLEELEAIDVRTLGELRAWIRQTPRGKALARGWPMAKDQYAELPDAPGVYRMLRVDGSLLYIGKARSLKKRVRSYFSKRRAIPDRTVEMLSQARALDVTRTETPLEAALLEQEEIKRRAPRYNVALQAERRRVWFATRDLRSIAEAPDDRHVVGPVADPRVLEGLPELLAALRGDRRARPALLSATWGPKDERLDAGLAAFARRHPAVPLTLRSLLALGKALWPRDRSRGDDDEVPPDDYWQPDTVADLVEDRWIRAAHAIRRARWLRVLSESSVAWTDGERTRLLVFVRGTLESRDWLDDPAALPPTPPGATRSQPDRRAAFDVTVRDRLRVLTTELRRLVDDGAEPRVRTAPAGLVRGPALSRLLHHV